MAEGFYSPPLIFFQRYIMYDARMTELDAVNRMLTSVGEAPVAAIDAGLSDAATAQSILHEVSRSIQLQGWLCNTVKAREFTPDGDDRIVLPMNVLKVRTAKYSKQYSVAVKPIAGDFVLYNVRDNSYEWPYVNTMYLDVIYFLPFDELTPALQWMITAKSGHEFQKGYLGSPLYYEFTAEEVYQATIAAEDEENEVGALNIFTHSAEQYLHSYVYNPYWGVR